MKMKILEIKKLAGRLGLPSGVPSTGKGVQWSKYFGKDIGVQVCTLERVSHDELKFKINNNERFSAQVQGDGGTVTLTPEAAMMFETFEAELSALDIEMPYYEV